MRRVRLHELGWDGALRGEEFAAAPEAGQVLVAVEAAGVCHRDLIDRGGGVPFLRLPMTLGHEVCGRVVALGPGTARWRIGDRVGTLHRDSCGGCAACAAGETTLCERAMFVFGILADGGYATHLVAPESALYRLPEGMDAGVAAVLQCTYGTAYRGLRAGGCADGMHALVVGAAGGVGSAAVAVARRLGARVTAVVRSDAQRAHVEAMGANLVVVDREGGFHKRVEPVDVAIDCVGQPTLNATLRSLRLGGRAVAVGNLVPERLALNVGLVIVKALQIIGSSGATARDMAQLLALDVPVTMPIRCFALDDAEAAQRAVRAGGGVGRVVLRPA